MRSGLRLPFLLLRTTVRIDCQDNGPQATRPLPLLSPTRLPVTEAIMDDQGALGHARSPHWHAVREAHITREPTCQGCGLSHGLNVHHVKPFHLHRDLELDPANLITLCESAGHNCHLWLGHLGSWKSFNARVRIWAKAFFRAIKHRP
jgi:hypothetical protein